MGPGAFGYAAGYGAIDVQREIQANAAADAAAASDAENATWAIFSFLVGGAAVAGVWYFYYRPKSRR